MAEKIKNYWETRLPFNDKIKRPERYKQFNYILKDAEFKEHRGERVLEIECGVGTDSLEYAKGGASIYGIDLTDSAIKITKRKFNLKGNFKRMNAENLRFKDDSFDLVYSFGVLHHIPNIEQSIREIKRVLRDNGKAIIFLYAKGWMYKIYFPLYYGLLKGELNIEV